MAFAVALSTCSATQTGCANREALARVSACDLDHDLATVDLATGLFRASALPASASTGAPFSELYLSFPLSEAADPPLLIVTASHDSGTFIHGIASGTYRVRSEDTDPVHCGLCITLIGPLDETQARPTYTYSARSGTLRIQELGGDSGRVRGILERVRLHQVERDEHTGSFTPRSCTTRIRDMRFDVPLELLEWGTLI
jgi:hypothetical protein